MSILVKKKKGLVVCQKCKSLTPVKFRQNT